MNKNLKYEDGPIVVINPVRSTIHQVVLMQNKNFFTIRKLNGEFDEDIPFPISSDLNLLIEDLQTDGHVFFQNISEITPLLK